MAFLFCVAIAGNIRSPALSQKAALHLPFSHHDPACEKGVAERSQAFRYSEI